jgi:hypothetical protein
MTVDIFTILYELAVAQAFADNLITNSRDYYDEHSYYNWTREELIIESADDTKNDIEWVNRG